MNYLDIHGVEYGFCRGNACGYTDKFNRMVKLAYMFEELSQKFDGMIKRGNCISDNARLALACKMMLYTGIRIGNEGSAEGYMTKPLPKSKEQPRFVKTYGLTTLLREHLVFSGRRAVFRFLGKKHVDNTFEVGGSLAKQIRSMAENFEGETLFGITDYQLTKFVKKYVGARFTPKDFRTLRANMLAYEMLSEISGRLLPSTKKAFNSEVREIAVYVSEHLNNTPAVCKASYIDPKFWNEVSEVRPITK